MTSIIANRYRIFSELGKGGMGTVYKAEDSLTENIVAIKRLNPELTAPELIERFRREGEALRELNHPNIVRMLDAVEENGNHYLIIEFLGGGDLNILLKQGRLPVEKVLSIGIDICDALTRAHRLNIIHRDLKPANVLLAEDGTPRLTDFGIAHFAGKARVTDSDVIIGTVDYLAPEILDGAGIDPRADIWAFGVMLFEMLSGTLPFTGQSITQTLLAIATQPTPDLESLCPDAPIALVDLVYRMLEKDPHARIASVRHVGAELEDILQGRTGTKRQAADPTRFATPTPDFLHRPKHNLPAQTTPFVGREAELAELARLLDNSKIRFITIVAQGGMGKTRLSLEAAERQIPNFEQGVYCVELAPLSDRENIIPAIANALSYQFQDDGREPKQQICDLLQGKELLLLMDNFEHLLAGAGLVTELLNAAPRLKILVTSRQRLDQSGESLFHLSGMDFPDWETPEDALQYAAVKLFMNSAVRARPSFELTKDNLNYVARICKLVQGMPLGIVLAAAWLGMLSPEEIGEELQKGLDFLESDSQHIPERQRSMRAVMEYSWQLMTEGEQAVFAKLSVFRGGFTRETAEAVAGANLRILMSLVNKSLLHRDSETGRYEIHELLRQYAEEQLLTRAELDITRNAHCACYAETLHSYEQTLFTHRFFEICRKLNADFENVHAAWQWAIEQNNLQALYNMMLTLSNFLPHYRPAHRRTFREVAHQVQVNAENERYYGRLLSLSSTGSEEDYRKNHHEALRIARKYGNQADTTRALLHLAMRIDQLDAGLEHTREALAIAESLDDDVLQAEAYGALAYITAVLGNDLKKAIAYWEKSQAFVEKTGNVLSNAAENLATAKSFFGDSKPYHEYWLSYLERARQSQAIGTITYALHKLAGYYADEGDFKAAWRCIAEYRSYKELQGESMDFEAYCAGLAADVLVREAHYNEALENWQKLAHYYETIRSKRHLGQEAYIDSSLTRILIACGQGDYTTLEQYFRPTLQQANEYRQSITGLVTLLLAYQFLLLRDGDYERSVEIAALVLSQAVCPPVYHTFPLNQAWEKQVRIVLSNELFEAAFERGKTLDFEATVQQIIADLGDNPS